MNSLRLHTLISFINSNDKVVDVGCDHAYLSIYLAKNKLCQKVIATDINQNALENAQRNILKNHLSDEILLILSDGLQNVFEEFDTVVLSGMGAKTILHILENVDDKKVKKLVIQSNNDLYLLRKTLKKRGYYLAKEKVIYEKNHYYTISVFTPTYIKRSIRELLFGIYDASFKNYYHTLYQEYSFIYKKKGKKISKGKILLFLKLQLLKKYL